MIAFTHGVCYHVCMKKLQKGELVHVKPRNPLRHENPYRAALAFNYEVGGVCGIMRIQPPLVCDASYLEDIRNDVGVEFVPRMMGREAALFDFQVVSDVAYDGMTPEDRVAHSARTVVEDAGRIASLNILALDATEYYDDESGV